jgi:hypothetical protein
MANQIIIDIGAVANDGTGDPLRTAFNYVNNNFSNVWNKGLPDSNIAFSNNKIVTVTTNGNLILAPNGTGKVQANVDIVPNINLAHSLGSPTRRWNTVYVQDFDATGDNTFSGNLYIGGNLTVEGDTIQIGNIVTDTKTIQLSNTAVTANAANGSGVTVGANDNIATFLYNSTSNVWTTNIGVSATGNISGRNINIGNVFTANGVYGEFGAFTGGSSRGLNSIQAGVGTFTFLGSDVIAQFTGNSNAYTQFNFQNINNGTQASGDFVITADNGNDSTHFLNIGLAGSNWDGTQPNSLGNRLGPNDGYLYVQDGDIVIGTSNGAIETWKFDQDGNLTIPGSIVGTDTILIDNRASGNTADIQLYSADDILLQARDRTAGSTSEGGDINIYAGDSAEDSDSSGGDIQILAGDGGAGNVDFASTGGFITIRSGQGGAAIGNSGASAAGGGSLTLQAGSAGDNNGNIDLGANGGDVVITAGLSTGNLNPGGDVQITSGQGGANASAGQIELNVPSSDAGPGGTWSFNYTGNLTLPAGGSIIVDGGDGVIGPDGDNMVISWDNEDLILRAVGSDVDVEADRAFNIRVNYDGGANDYLTKWVFAQDNEIVNITGNSAIVTEAGNLNLQGGRNTLSSGNVQITAVDNSVAVNTWTFDNTGNLTFPDGTTIIDGGVNGTASSTVSLNAFSPDGNTVSFQAQGNTSSAVISIFSNAGPVTSNWTFTTAPLDPSESFLYVPNGGAISTPDATGGEGGKNIFIQAGASDPVTWNSNPGGELFIKGGYGSFGDGGGGPGGNVYIEGGLSSDSHAGNVNITTGSNSWVFDYSGNVTIPGNINAVMSSPAPSLNGFDIVNAVTVNASGNISGNTAGFAIGYRDIPQVSFTGNATIATTDAGKHFYSTQSSNFTLTIANNASQGFQVGAAITVVNQGTGTITVAQGSGVTLYLAGNATSGNRSVATFGMATIMKVDTNTWFINGTGVS